MAISITPSPFGSVTVTLDGELGGVLQASILATSNSVLNMDLGVPGPQGEAGEPGANGQNGVGVAAGGLTNQVLVKLSNADYDTGWATITSGGGTWGSITGTLSNQTDLYSALNGKLSLTGGSMTGDIAFLVDGNGDDTAVGSFGLGTENTDGKVAYIEPTQIRIYDSTHLIGTALNGTGITFNDETVQVTAGLPLTGGTMTGSLTINSGDLSLDSQGGIYDALVVSTGQINFGDSSTQTTAFPPSGGTTSQYIDGTGALQTYGPLGDRYLTSSTSTLTCDSGNGKTMTVGTGLSYSRQQDITVSYDTANHMHGTVLTYNSTTGVMTFDSNTHSGGGTYSNWQVNVGGVAGAILPVGGSAGQVLAKINSTNFNTEWISLGSMAQATTTDYLAKADNLSGLASTTTARTNLGLGAVATDAYATTAQAEAMTSTTAVISPARFRDAYFTANVSKPNTSTWLTATTGTGGINDGGNGDFRRLQGPTSAANTIVRASHTTNFRRGGDFNSNIDWTKYNALYFRLRQSGADTNSTFIITLGENDVGAGNADPAVRCVGIKFNYGGVVKILAHNGTTLVQPSTSYTPATLSGIDFLIVSDGSGTVEVFANGTSIGTTTGGPTTLLAGTAQQQCINARVFNNSTPSGNQLSVYIGGVTAYTS